MAHFTSIDQLANRPLFNREMVKALKKFKDGRRRFVYLRRYRFGAAPHPLILLDYDDKVFPEALKADPTAEGWVSIDKRDRLQFKVTRGTMNLFIVRDDFATFYDEREVFITEEEDEVDDGRDPDGLRQAQVDVQALDQQPDLGQQPELDNLDLDLMLDLLQDLDIDDGLDVLDDLDDLAQGPGPEPLPPEQAARQHFADEQKTRAQRIKEHITLPVRLARQQVFKKGDAKRLEAEVKGRKGGHIDPGTHAKWVQNLPDHANPVSNSVKQAMQRSLGADLDTDPGKARYKELADSLDAYVKAVKSKDIKKAMKEHPSWTEEDALMNLAQQGWKAEWIGQFQGYFAPDDANAVLNALKQQRSIDKRMGEFDSLMDTAAEFERKGPKASSSLRKKLTNKAQEHANKAHHQYTTARNAILERYAMGATVDMSLVGPELAALDSSRLAEEIRIARTVLLEMNLRGHSLDGVIKAQKKVEEDKSLKNIDALIEACETFLELYNHPDLWAVERMGDSKKKENEARFALKYARLLKLGFESEAIGDPPWDRRTAARAAELEVQMHLIENSQKDRLRPEGATVSGTWFVELNPRDKKGQKTQSDKALNDVFIFKPLDAEPDEDGFGEVGPGWQQGDGAPREVLAKAASDVLTRISGIDIGVCETHLIEIPSNRLPEKDGSFKEGVGPNRLGAVQRMAESDQSAGAFLKEGLKDIPFDLPKDQIDAIETRNAAAMQQKAMQLPTTQISNIALFDMLTLQMDRHAGNLLIKDTPGGKQLIPIDHGISLPTREAFVGASARMGVKTNVLAQLPQVDQPLANDALQTIARLDPEEYAQSLSTARDDMVAGHPEVDGHVTDESIEIARRSALLLKAAAAQLTMGELMGLYHGFVQYQGNSEPPFVRVIDAQPGQLQAVIGQVIQEAIAARG